MGGRLIGLLGLVVAFVLAAQLRGSLITQPTGRSLLALAAFVAGVVLVAGVLGSNLKRRNRLGENAFSPDSSNRRQTYRIQYPPEERPRLTIRPAEGPPEEWEVLDLSEEGLRCRRHLDSPLPEELAGELFFSHGRRIPVAGSLVRSENGEVSLQLRRTVPPDLVVSEQLRLLAHLRSHPHSG